MNDIRPNKITIEILSKYKSQLYKELEADPSYDKGFNIVKKISLEDIGRSSHSSLESESETAQIIVSILSSSGFVAIGSVTFP